LANFWQHTHWSLLTGIILGASFFLYLNGKYDLAQLGVGSHMGLRLEGLVQRINPVDHGLQAPVGEGRQKVGCAGAGDGDSFLQRARTEGDSDQVEPPEGQEIEVELSHPTGEAADADQTPLQSHASQMILEERGSDMIDDYIDPCPFVTARAASANSPSGN